MRINFLDAFPFIILLTGNHQLMQTSIANCSIRHLKEFRDKLNLIHVEWNLAHEFLMHHAFE